MGVGVKAVGSVKITDHFHLVPRRKMMSYVQYHHHLYYYYYHHHHHHYYYYYYYCCYGQTAEFQVLTPLLSRLMHLFSILWSLAVF